MNNKRNERNQKLIDSGVIWVDSITNRWCRKCPNCFSSLTYSSFGHCQIAYTREDKCSKCFRSENNKSTELLIKSGDIWKNKNNTWGRKCPQCSTNLSHSKKNRCLYSNKHKIVCLSCSKSGKNNPNNGTHRTTEVKEKLRNSNLGKHISSKEHRQKLSQSQINSGKNYFINNCGLVNGYKYKSYTFPNGRVERVQGYEPYTLNYLLSSSIDCDNIKVKSSEKPVIFYNWSGSLHRYFPDCYLTDSNTIVETKSQWTWEFQKDKNMSKISGSLNSGYNVRMLVWEGTRYNKTLISDTTYHA